MAQAETALADAIACVEGRFGTHVLSHGAIAERRADERRIQTGSEPDDAPAVLAALGAASLLVHSFDRMQVLGMFLGDGLKRVSALMLSDAQELAAGAHAHIAG